MGTSMHELNPDPSYRRWGPACMNLVQTLAIGDGGPACMNLVQTLATGDGDQHPCP